MTKRNDFRDIYPTSVRRVGEEGEISADSVVYREIWSRLPVTGLPDSVKVGEVDCFFASGPILTQKTNLRQRPGLPVAYDKHMERAVPVGDDELVTVTHLRVPMPESFRDAMDDWRATTRAALGFLCAVLDERVALRRLGEDAVLLAGDRPVAAADGARNVRAFMPFDVEDRDLAALEQLGDMRLDHATPVYRAASLYRLGAQQGPTPEGFLFLWLAVDALTDTRKTQKHAVASLLSAAGFDLEWLNLPLGRLVGLRGDVAHGKHVDHEATRQGYYDMEAIARAAIRNAACLSSGWPASLGTSAFRIPLARRIADSGANPEVHWHEHGLPRPDPNPPATGLPRADAVLGEHDRWIAVTGAADSDQERMLRFWALDAVDVLAVDVEPFVIEVCSDEDCFPAGVDRGVNAERVLLSPEAASPQAPGEEVRLAYHMCRLIAEMQVMRIGFMSEGLGSFLIEMAGAWAAYREWVLSRELPADQLTREPLEHATIQNLGAYIGIALAGDEAAQQAIGPWLANPDVDEDLKSFVVETLTELGEVSTFGELLDFVRQLADVIRSAQEEAHQPDEERSPD